MNMVDIIYKKREGQPLTEEEIQYFVTGYTDGRIPDYQASALLMAIYFQGMNKEETYHLTKVMMHSGDVVDLSQIKGIKVDKHSTGGVGDKTTLIVGPLAAACQVPVAKMSGRGLGFTGGTIDKLEAIPSFQTTVEENAFIDQVNGIGLAIIGQTAHIAPADKSLYALRDVTATVENLSLITSSIMSKKLASGSDAIVLDVKWGTGAFMESLEEAEELGRLMVDIGQEIGKKTLAVITDMNQPLGKAVGNSLEVIEAIETLKGRGPEDIMELSLKLAAYMIFAGGKAASPEEGYELAKNALETGAALKKLEALIKSQGGAVHGHSFQIKRYLCLRLLKWQIWRQPPWLGYLLPYYLLSCYLLLGFLLLYYQLPRYLAWFALALLVLMQFFQVVFVFDLVLNFVFLQLSGLKPPDI